MNNLVPEKKSEDGLIVAVLSMTIAVGRGGHRCWKRRRGKEEGNGLEDAVEFVIIEKCVKGREGVGGGRVVLVIVVGVFPAECVVDDFAQLKGRDYQSWRPSNICGIDFIRVRRVT